MFLLHFISMVDSKTDIKYIYKTYKQYFVIIYIYFYMFNVLLSNGHVSFDAVICHQKLFYGDISSRVRIITQVIQTMIYRGLIFIQLTRNKIIIIYLISMLHRCKKMWLNIVQPLSTINGENSILASGYVQKQYYISFYFSSRSLIKQMLQPSTSYYFQLLFLAFISITIG